MPTKEEQVRFAKNEGNFAELRNRLSEIKDTIRFMSLGTQFKDFMDDHLEACLARLYDLQHGN